MSSDESVGADGGPPAGAAGEVDVLEGASAQQRWDAQMWAMQGQRAPFSVLVEYASALVADSAPADSSGEITVPTPLVCLIALAGYEVAAQRDELADTVADLVMLRDVLARLEDDARARRLVTLEPGNPVVAAGRVRSDDRDALVHAASTDVDTLWQQWRQDAVAMLRTQIQTHPAARFADLVDVVRRWRVRRGWYDDPSLPATHNEDASPGQRSAP